MTSPYLELLKQALTGMLWKDPGHPYDDSYDERLRKLGIDMPRTALTMIGLKRLDNIEYCLKTVLDEGIPGDFMECGVWRGGACIFARAVLKEWEQNTLPHMNPDFGLSRHIIVADSFSGFPPLTHPIDIADLEAGGHQANLGVSLEEVQANFAKYNLLDEQVMFLPGYFQDTLPKFWGSEQWDPPTNYGDGITPPKLAVLRLDADLYQSTKDILDNLYEHVSLYGYIIVDDYWPIAACRHAVTEFRRKHAITSPIHRIDWSGVYWRKGEVNYGRTTQRPA